ncbi:MAG: hypothetical protein OJF49_000495 [Ktedonobacterales bacterium]|nr:MAG: hypothetical protein OJF49_000495 [Ktedonobacterales bacterium]
MLLCGNQFMPYVATRQRVWRSQVHRLRIPWYATAVHYICAVEGISNHHRRAAPL